MRHAIALLMAVSVREGGYRKILEVAERIKRTHLVGTASCVSCNSGAFVKCDFVIRIL
jgi:hypothetical protein